MTTTPSPLGRFMLATRKTCATCKMTVFAVDELGDCPACERERAATAPPPLEVTHGVDQLAASLQVLSTSFASITPAALQMTHGMLRFAARHRARRALSRAYDPAPASVERLQLRAYAIDQLTDALVPPAPSQEARHG